MSGGLWQQGLFGCFSDMSVCLVAFFVPCYTAGKNAEAVGESCLAHGLFTLVPILNVYCFSVVRGKIREKKSIEGTFFNDILLSLFCPFCILAQEAQELKPPSALSMARE